MNPHPPNSAGKGSSSKKRKQKKAMIRYDKQPTLKCLKPSPLDSAPVEILPMISTYAQFANCGISELLTLTNDQLSRLYQRAPAALQHCFTLNQCKPVETLLKMREAALKQMQQHQDNDQKPDQLISDLTVSDLEDLAVKDPERLAKMVRHAKESTRNMPNTHFRSVPPAAMRDFVAALTYKCQTYKEMLDKHEAVMAGVKETMTEESYTVIFDMLSRKQLLLNLSLRKPSNSSNVPRKQK